jgi:integrase
MPVSNSTKSRPNKKPKKPYDGFPLTAHRNGQWCKKHRGKQFYFGLIDDWQSALKKYQWDWPYIIEGRTPPATGDGDYCTLSDACNSFLTSKRNRLDGGELSSHTFAKYYETCELLIDHFGRDRRVDDLRPEDFERFRKVLGNGCGAVTLKSKINRCRVVLKYAHDNRLIEHPIEFGQSFNRPSEKMMRKARNQAGPRMFEADEIHNILSRTDPILKAMVLLGINCGFGNTDVASLPQTSVDLDSGWVEFPRPKTEIRRRIPLWPETVAALREALAIRPEPTDSTDADLCFVTLKRNRFVRVQESKRTPGKFVTINAVARRFDPIVKKLGINGRKGLGFYTLRHTFATIAGESRDQVAVNAIMGHVDSSMAGAYRERISDERLIAVTDTVHQWLFPAQEGGAE